ncbi:Uncharacterised protein [Campylobacter insulaenigrae]|uniref:hypothetical protein n=1 Tax=Campylobacter insulaenigrae TaxID=260714 RepID=UPI000F6FB87F|nr:hypothetical protein [Campylobacter insulaenigrae]MCR6590530.1 hypothetical protein [Campylobacter insulaenigrae]MCR6592067.1 hypothetical protein [Campylobacter insulaenigrae]VEJ53379.1 Uncharacterised protein [Campylobacter insulaenigrae]
MGYRPNIVSNHVIKYAYNLKIPQYGYQDFLNALDDLDIDYYQTELNRERVEISVNEINNLSLNDFEGSLLELVKILKKASKYKYAKDGGFVIIDFF